MKKILGIIGLFGLVLMSCKNDAIDIDKSATPEPPKTVSISVSTTSAYEKYGLTDYQNYLGSNPNVYIGVTSLLYDANGVLVDSVSSYSRTFNTLTQDIDGVYNGQYTLITFETFVDSNKGFKSNNWRLADVNRLETVQIHNEEYNVVDWQYSIGVSTSTVSVNSNTQTSVQANSSPKAIGVLLDLGYENFNKSGYIWLGFELKNVASGYYLNPSLSSNERYKYDDGYNAEHTWSSRGSFYNSSGLPNSNSKKFYMLESGNIQYCFGATATTNESGGFSFMALPSDNSYFNFVDGEYYKGYAYYKGFGDNLETYIGSQGDFSAWRTKVLNDIDATPVLGDFYMKWGTSVDDVKTNMKNYRIYDETPEALESGKYRITYAGKNKEDQIGYLFNTESGDLAIVNVFWNPVVVTKSEVVDYLKTKGYTLMSSSDDETALESKDKKTKVRVFTNTAGDILAQFSANVLFRQPYIVWGGSVSAVKSYMSGYKAGNDAPEASGDNYVLWYYGKDKEIEIDYYFKTNTSNLQFVNVFFESSIGEDEIQSEIVNDGFSLALYDEDNNTYYYLSSDEKTVAAFRKNSEGYWVVQYYAYSSSGARTRNAMGTKSTFGLKGNIQLNRKANVEKKYDDVKYVVKLKE